MTKFRVAISSCIERTTGIAGVLLVLPLLLFCSAADAETPPATEAVTDTQDITELKIYKQRLKVKADVLCRAYERRPMFCTAQVLTPVSAVLQPELILKYSAMRLGDKEFQPETTPDANLKFRGDDKVNYTGEQELDIEVIYVK